MNSIARLALLLAFALGGCAGGDEPAETAGPISLERNTSFNGEVLRLSIARKDGGRERFSSLRDQWYSRAWQPALPNQSGRRWTLRKADRDGTSIAYAVVSWDNDDPTDYLAAGYWLRFPGPTRRFNSLAGAETSAFIDGPEIDMRRPAELPLSGTASYAGEAGGVYAYRYGSSWTGNEEPVSSEEFVGTMTVQVDFDAMTIAGCIGCVGDLRIERAHLYTLLGWRAQVPLALPKDYQIHFAPTEIRRNASFEGTDATVVHPTRSVTQSEGLWGGQLSNRQAADGNPRLAAGLAGAKFEEADGSQGRFDTIFTVLHPSLLPPGRGR